MWLLLSVLLAALWFFPFAAQGRLVGILADDALYLLMADHYSPWAQPEAVVEYANRVSQFPPLYPLLLGLLGGGSAHLDVAFWVQTLCLIVACALLAQFARRLCSSTAAGLAVFWLLALAPLTLQLCSEIWSEFAYLMISGGALLLALRARDEPRWWWPVALLCGLAACTRGVGITLIGALLLTLLRQAPRRYWWSLLLAVLPAGSLAVLHLGGSTDYLQIFQDRTGSLGTALAGISSGAAAMWSGWLRFFALRPGLLVQLLGAATLLLALAGWWPRLRALELDAGYTLAYLGLTLIWPFPEVTYRLVYPIVPLLVVYAALGLIALGARRAGRPRQLLAAGVPLLLLAAAVPDTATMVWRYLAVAAPDVPGARVSRYWLTADDPVAAANDLRLKQGFIDLAHAAGGLVPADGCLHSLHPQLVMFHARRVSFPPTSGGERSARPACRFHLALGDSHMAQAVAGFWQPYRVLLAPRMGGYTIGILVEYP